MTEHDIISINQLIEICTNNTNIGTQNESTTNKINRSESWKLFIEELKKYHMIINFDNNNLSIFLKY